MNKDPILAATTLAKGHRLNHRDVPLSFIVEGGLCYLHGNRKLYFSLTCTIHRKGFPNQCQGGGAAHDDILALYPQFKDLANLCLSDINGEPMCAVENGWYNLVGAIGGLNEKYHVGNSERNFHCKPPSDKPWEDYECRCPTRDECLQIFADYVRISLSEARQIVTEIANIAADRGVKAAKQFWADYVEELKPRWKEQADACIAKHRLLVYGDCPTIFASKWKPEMENKNEVPENGD